MRAIKQVRATGLLMLILSIALSTALAADTPTDSGKEKRAYVIGIPIFKNQKEMKQWIHDKLNSADIQEFERGGRKVCVAFNDIGSGNISQDVYIFITHRASATWGNIAIWRTYTAEVKVAISKNGKDLIFKSKSGKPLFSASFEALEPKNDPDY